MAVENVNVNKQERLTAEYYLLSALLFFKFVPFPVFKHLGFGLENICIMLLLILLLFNSSKLFELSSTNARILALLTVYVIITHVLGMFRGEDTSNFASSSFVSDIKSVLYITFIIICCSGSSYRFTKIVKLFVILAVMSVLFGMLVYLFGGPFASLRYWLSKSQSYSRDIFIGKGSQLSGIYCPPAVFGYMMAVAPILCLALYSAEKKLKWLFAFIICIIGLFLNAERAAMLVNIIMIGIWFRHQQGKVLIVMALMCIAIAVVGLQQTMPTLGNEQRSKQRSSYAAGDLSERMKGTDAQGVLGRFAYQMHGIRTVMDHPLMGATYLEYTQMVHSDGSTRVASTNRLSQLSKRTLEPHDLYINMGIKAGILGWIILIIFFNLIRKITTSRNMQHITGDELTVLRKALTMSLFAVIGVAVFHNAGIFSGELASCTVLAFIMTLNNMKRKAEVEKINYGVS